MAFLTGATRMIDLRRKNLGVLDVQGVDFTFNYRIPVGPGNILLNWAGTKNYKWKTRVSPTAAQVDQFVNGTQIKWRHRSTVAFASKTINASLSFNYVGAYSNVGVAAQPTVKPFKTFDFAASYNLGDSGFLKGLQLTLNVDNLTNKEPPIRFTGNGYSTVSNPLGRTWTVGFRKSF